MAAKEVRFSSDARDRMLRGVERVLSYWSDGYLDHEDFVRSVLR